MKKNILFDIPISVFMEDELLSRIFFVSDEIETFQLKKDKEFIYSIDLDIQPETDIEIIKEKLNKLLNKDIRNRKYLKTNRIWENDIECKFKNNIYNKMLEEGIAIPMGEGQIAFSSKFFSIMDKLDLIIKNKVKEILGAVEYRYPTLISTDTIKKCGYFDSFPHFQMLVTRLHNDIDNYIEFKDRVFKDKDLRILDYCRNTDYSLPPTMCYYTYNQFSNKKFNEHENMVITSKGKSFRYESKYYKTIERLWDFTIREIVFLGSYQFVKNCREKVMEFAFELITNLQLKGICETASDPFFIDENGSDKAVYQRRLKSKYELRLNISSEETIAVASFNYHDSFFAEKFNLLYSKEKFIKTGCTGFGLERLVYAFITQHGYNEDEWPDNVKEYIFKMSNN